jgi:SEFIR domain
MVLPPRTFISYTHDGDDHRKRVLHLADRLREDGVDARLDRFVSGTPEGGWPAWMESELAAADFVLVVCTPAYHERYQQDGETRRGLGGRWESSLIRDSLYADSRELERFIPVLPKLSSRDDIPTPLRHRATHYRLDDYEGILRHLTSQPETPPRPTGPLRVMHARDEQDSAPTESPRFSPSITEVYKDLDRIVERLTSEQYDVIARLNGTARALISGSAGSGKTLVAAEKAIRLDHAGIRTLFLCHNPLLAEWVASLVRPSSVDVRAFEDLVRELAAEADDDVRPWSSYSQPTREQLRRAVAALAEHGRPFGAVIVDEGQDFAEEWWRVVEACVPADATLYVFFDEQQSLLPNRLHLPAMGWPSTLSRNCRNAGRVYEVMRRLAPIRELPDRHLEGLGEVAFFARPSLRDSVQAALSWLDEIGALPECSAVLGGGVRFEESALAVGGYDVGEPFDWRAAVRQQVTRVSRMWSGSIRTDEVEAAVGFHDLSDAAVPTASDRAIVEGLANALLSHTQGWVRTAKAARVTWRPVADAQRAYQAYPNGASILVATPSMPSSLCLRHCGREHGRTPSSLRRR